MEKEKNLPKKIFILGGNEREALKNSAHNVAWNLTDEVFKKEIEKAGGYKEILKKPFKTIAVEIEYNNEKILLVKPMALNAMNINPKGFEEYFKSLNLKESAEFYGYDETYKNEGFGYGDYNSGGFAVRELLKKGIISKDDKIFLISDDNAKLKENEIKVSYADLERDNENNFIRNCISLNSEVLFKRVDISTYQKGTNKKVLDNFEIKKDLIKNFENSIKRELDFKKIDKNIEEYSVDDLIYDLSLKFEKRDKENLFKLFEISFNKLTSIKDEGDISKLKNNLIKMVFLIKKDKEFFKEFKKDKRFEDILEFFNKNIETLSNKKNYLSYNIKIEEEYKEKKILSPIFDGIWGDGINTVNSFNAKLEDLNNSEINIFDKKHYENEKTFNELCKKVDEKIKSSDCIMLFPNYMNINEFFKEPFEKSIDLKNADNSIVRTFWESYCFAKSVEFQKGIYGICGGMQIMSSVLGLDVDKLNKSKNQLKGNEDDFISSPRLKDKNTGRYFVDVYSQHGFGVELNKNNEAKLKDLNIKYAIDSNKETETSVIEDLRFVDKNGEDRIFATQYHPEEKIVKEFSIKERENEDWIGLEKDLHQKNRSYNIFKDFLDGKTTINRDSKIGKATIENFNKIFNNLEISKESKEKINVEKKGKKIFSLEDKRWEEEFRKTF